VDKVPQAMEIVMDMKGKLKFSFFDPAIIVDYAGRSKNVLNNAAFLDKQDQFHCHCCH